MTEMKQFGRTEALQFKIGNEVFDAAPEISAEVMLDMSNMRERMGEDDDHRQKIKVMVEVFRDILSAESHRKLVAGLKSKKKPGDEEGVEPIGIGSMMQVVEWLFGEVYGGRPTQPPQS